MKIQTSEDNKSAKAFNLLKCNLSKVFLKIFVIKL